MVCSKRAQTYRTERRGPWNQAGREAFWPEGRIFPLNQTAVCGQVEANFWNVLNSWMFCFWCLRQCIMNEPQVFWWGGGFGPTGEPFVRGSCRVDYWLSSAMEIHAAVEGDYGDLNPTSPLLFSDHTSDNKTQLMCFNQPEDLRNWVQRLFCSHQMDDGGFSLRNPLF